MRTARKNQIHIVVTDDEKKRIEANADAVSLTTSSYLRLIGIENENKETTKIHD